MGAYAKGYRLAHRTAKQKLRHDSEIGAERVRNEASKGIECGNKWTPLPAGDWDSEGLVRVCVCELARRECESV